MMDDISIAAIQTALKAYQPGDLLALSDLHETLLAAVQSSPESPLNLDLQGCAQTIEDQLAGGAYDLDDLFFENIQRILTRAQPRDPASPLPPPSADPTMMVSQEYVETFCLELDDRLGQAQELILKLEANQASEEERNVLFRLFHTIKGEAGFLKLSVLMGLFHSLEGLLDGLRKERLAVTPPLVARLFEGVDLAEEARRALAGGKYDLREFRHPVEALERSVAALLSGAGENLPPPNTDGPKILDVTPGKQEEGLVKVSGAKLSYLVDMVGEMLILQNQMADDSKETQMLRKVSREVQQAAMSLRTVNLKPLFTKMRRAVRDISQQLGKPVVVEVVGETNEIDRALVEAMEEPLVHLVRNCIGHGIEDQPTRLEHQKPGDGKVVLSAERRGNHVILGIEDDGKGLAPLDIVTTAVKNGVIAPEVADKLTNEQIYELIFLDGLSTAQRVDDISGRGVGMSIVKKTVEKFRGHIHIKTAPGVGTRFDLVFPLSMAILDGMIIELGEEKFILPVENVLEAVRIQPHLLVDITGGGRILRLRGDVVPVVDLTEFFYGDHPHVQTVAVLVENNQHDRFALLVEKVLEKREVVIKSLGHRFQNLVGISAAAIMRGGEIGYLVDIDAVTRPPGTRRSGAPT